MVPRVVQFMRSSSLTFFFLLFLRLSSLTIAAAAYAVSRLDFPPEFVFGAGSSAYQVEGAATEDGRKPSIWDTYTHAGKVTDGSTGDIASDQYHHYKEDVKLMHEMGITAYRLSISWSRLIPDGHGAVNPKGLNYYNNLINELLNYGIEAHITLSHFDVPQALEDEYQGYLSPKFIEDFTAYADICFKEYGDRVKSWTTFNEPNMQTVVAYDLGTNPPEHCSYPFGFQNCSHGDSTTEPYLAAHNILLSHAAAVLLYRNKYQEKQRGLIGLTLHAAWFEPKTDSPQDAAARQRALDFHLGWFLDPIVHGNYPSTMRKFVGSRLPFFTKNELKQLKGSFDFIGLNHYTVYYVGDLPRTLPHDGRDYLLDVSVSISVGLSAMDFTRLKVMGMSSSSWALQRLLEYVKLKYGNPAVIIYENGYMTTGDDSSNLADRNDTGRVEFLQRYIERVLLSLRSGSNVKGYFVWSFMDSFEFYGGYSMHYGLYGVDFNDKDRKRYPRMSAHWYTSFLAKNARNPATSTYLFSE